MPSRKLILCGTMSIMDRRPWDRVVDGPIAVRLPVNGLAPQRRDAVVWLKAHGREDKIVQLEPVIAPQSAAETAVAIPPAQRSREHRKIGR